MPNVTITIEDSLLAKAKRKAKAECRSLSQQVTFLLMQDSEVAKPARKATRKGAAA